MSVLNEICARKHLHVKAQKEKIPVGTLRKSIESAAAPRGFMRAVTNHPHPAIIAEIKKASPAHGIIRPDFNPESIAKIYESSGATCLSVLTDEPYFQGRDEYIAAAKSVSTLPVLRKDFIVDEYQVYESRALGADCILLIVAALETKTLVALHALAIDLCMDVLVEIHDEAELNIALAINPAMIGVNNRNLKTLAVDVQTSHALASKIPSSTLKISESGLTGRPTLDALRNAGYNGFLIGESLMRAPDIADALSALTRPT